ncbi:molybdenum cofactor biosynthesis protein MoaE [Pseudactinotalea sp. HY160]|uniref:molybdenum cofactor biosynthesis protein MoaE n=1 Tax=Pseudactinotalea sp. HY160 TaxID=2654490 RepID=UPI00128D47B1|nr:molybdenum cofactor biosynthesis protein MoaE [Pseudactinotalea sp. HY160]MPV48483.1 molybdenum cofactor biosynthesis protein MoaE [Pseudactinotalea sp. HY160]
MTDSLVRLSNEPLDVAAHLDHAGADWVGGVASFIGTVRNHSPDVDGEVVQLDYSAHPSAERVLAEIVAEVTAAHPGVRLAVSHRIGTLYIGDLAIVVAAGSSHRAEAFAACREAVETVKKKLPVWKRQVLTDGSYVWVGSA